MITLEFLIFKLIVAENAQVFVNQINVCFFFLKLMLSWKLVSVSQHSLPHTKDYIYSHISFSSKLNLFAYLSLTWIFLCLSPQIFKWEQVGPSYLCLPHGLETRLIRPFSVEPDFQVGQNCQESPVAPGNAEVNPGGEWDVGSSVVLRRTFSLKNMLPFVK